MPAGETLRVVLLGADTADTRTTLWVATGLFVLTGVIALVSEVASFSTGTLSLYAFVLLGAVFATAAAYRNSGLLPSWALVAGPVGGPLAVYRGFMLGRDAVPVGLPLSFYGTGAAAFWLPVTLLLGTLGFAVGALVRWTTTRLGPSVAGGTRSRP